MDRINVKIDKTAEVAPEAVIGAGSEVGPYCQIGAGVEIGENNILGSRIEITGRTRLGANNQIFTGAILGQAASYSNRRKQLEGLSKDEDFDLIIGDNNIIREYSVIYGSKRIGVEKEPTVIGDDNFLMAYIQIKPGARLESGITAANSSVLDEGCQIGEKAFLAGLAYIPEDIKIGRLSMVGACARIVDSLPPFLLADGNPASIESINVVGIRRADISRKAFSEIKTIYKKFSRDNGNTPIKDMSLETAEGKELQKFILEEVN
ncbi:MAG: hypothetical protein ACOC1W_02640 [Bacillota bacterium]